MALHYRFIDRITDGMQGLRWNIPESTAVQTYAYRDMVEVIRCAECSHSGHAALNQNGLPYCHTLCIEITPDFYCAYGTRDFIAEAIPVDPPKIQEQLDQNISDVDSLLT